MLRRFIWLPIALLMIAGLIIVLNRGKPSPYKGAPATLLFGNTPISYSMLLFIAQDRGFFNEDGLNVQFKDYESGLSALEALMKGEVEMAVAADFAFVNKSFERDDLRIVASIGTAGSEEIIARRDRNIEHVQDLKNKRIGVSLNTSAEFTLIRFLLFNQMNPEEVTLVDLGPVRLVEAIAAGEVDAVITWDIWAYEARKRLGESAVNWPARIGQNLYWLVITTRRLIEQKPMVVERFLRSMVRAEELAYANEAEARAIFRRLLNPEQAYMDFVWKRNRLGVSLDQGILTAMDGEAEWRLQSLPPHRRRSPNYLRFIYMDGLDAVKPNANTILR